MCDYSLMTTEHLKAAELVGSACDRHLMNPVRVWEEAFDIFVKVLNEETDRFVAIGFISSSYTGSTRQPTNYCVVEINAFP